MTINGPRFTVVLVGDAEFLAEAEPAIQASDDLLVIGAVDYDQAGSTAVGRAPDVVVISETGRPGDSAATDVARRVGAALPASRILVVAHGPAHTDPDRLIDSWVGGVIDLDGPDDLASAIERLALGEGFVSAPLAAAILSRHRAGSTPAPLSVTEEEVLGRLADGAAVADLADEYAVSPRLVRLHAGGSLARLHPHP
jgi:DNA-binding NarL/FixJ family response regulator